MADEKLERIAQLEQIVQDLTYWKDAVRLLDGMGETAVIVVNENGIIMLFNYGAEILTGYPRETMIGQSVDLLIPERLRSQHAGHRKEYMDSGPYIRSMGSHPNQLMVATKDQGEVTVSIMLNPVVLSWGRYVMTVLRKQAAVLETTG